MSEVASLELCRELYGLSGWADTTRGWHNFSLKGDKPFLSPTDFEPVNPKRIEGDQYHYPAYTADHLRDKLREYDYEIVNLNGNTLSLTSDSLDEPDAAILGATFAEVMSRLAIELFKSGILRKEE